MVNSFFTESPSSLITQHLPLFSNKMKSLDKCIGMLIALAVGTYFMFTMRTVTFDMAQTAGLLKQLGKKIPMGSSVIYKPEKSLIRRAQKVRDVCNKDPKLGDYTMKPGAVPKWLLTTFLRQEELSMLYCPVPKCGWSSWRTMFFQVLYKGDHTAILNDMSRTGWLTPWEEIKMTQHRLDEAKELGTDATLKHKMLFVRNPYDRLVSAYKDKALRDNGRYTREWKRPCSWITEESPTLTFNQFITCILDDVKKESEGKIESFSAGESLDMHWRPQSILCNVCAVNYNIIGHFDHMNDDVGAALKMLNMDVKPEWGNRDTAKEPLSKYYDELSKDQLHDLILLYNYDFEIFDFKNTIPV